MNYAHFAPCALLCCALSFASATALAAEEETSPELVELVVDLLKSPDPDMRALALDQVRNEAKGAAATKLFAGHLAKLPPEAQVGLLSALAERGDTAARPVVIEALGAKDPQVRVAALQALGFLGEPEDLNRLVKALSGETAVEQAAARASLVRLRGETVSQSLVGEMKAAPPALQIALINVLVARRALDTIPDLLQAAVGGDATVRGAAMSALGQLAGPEHLAGMVQGVLKAEPGAERVAAEKTIMFVCNRIEPAEQRTDALLAALDQLQPAERNALLPALGRVGGEAARKRIEAAIGDSDPAVHHLGLQAICNWPDGLLVARLTELFHAEKHPEHQQMTLGALIRVAPLPDGRSDSQRLQAVEQVMAFCTGEKERKVLLQRTAAVRTVESLRFILQYLDQPTYAQQACASVVELAHHRELRDSNKPEFHAALDRVIATSQDATVVDRAKRYKRGQTWTRPAAK